MIVAAPLSITFLLLSSLIVMPVAAVSPAAPVLSEREEQKIERIESTEKSPAPAEGDFTLGFHVAETQKKPGLREHQLADGTKVYLHPEALLSEKAIRSAVLVRDQADRYVIEIHFSPAGTRRFALITKKYRGRRLAILVRDRVISAPVIHETISGGRARISGKFTRKEAMQIIRSLNVPKREKQKQKKE